MLMLHLPLCNEKVTGNKSELVERLLVHHQSSGDISDDEANDYYITDDVAVSSDKVDTSLLDPSVNQLPAPLIEALVRYTSSPSPTLLPIQQQSYDIISRGQDAVLFSPTGTGKSLAFVLPLAARLFGWKHDGSLDYRKKEQKQRFMKQRQQRTRNKNDSLASAQSTSGGIDAAAPLILVVVPSRELARQVGKVWEKFHPTTVGKSSKRQVVTVYGGVPMTRHAALLGGKTDVVVGSESMHVCRISVIRWYASSPQHLRDTIT